jgi:hypothetical protein
MAGDRIREMAGRGWSEHRRTDSQSARVRYQKQNAPAGEHFIEERRDACQHCQERRPRKSSGPEVYARSIRMQPAIAISHRRNIAFDDGAEPDSGEFLEDPTNTNPEPR